MSNILQVNNLSKSFTHNGKTLCVLDDINFDIKHREFVSIIGPSGCGKSTLFHILSGLEKEDFGEIKIDDKKIYKRLGYFGYMFQEDLLLPWRTALENIMIGFEVKSIKNDQARKDGLKLLEEFHLEEFAHFYPSSLSGGMKQRIALLRTIAFNSNLLLLDEPFGSCDSLTRSSLQQYLLKLWKKFHLTVLFITHDIREAIILSDRIFVLEGSPAKIVKSQIVNLPRPRSIASLSSAESYRIEKALIDLLFTESLFEKS